MSDETEVVVPAEVVEEVPAIETAPSEDVSVADAPAEDGGDAPAEQTQIV